MFGSRLVRTVAFALSATLVSACGGGHGISSLPAVSGPGSEQQQVHAASATFSFSFKKDTAASAKNTRSPQYISSATKSVSVQVTDTKNAGTSADIYANVPAAMKAVQTANFANMTGNGSVAGQCGTDPSNGGNYKCTAKFQLPIGINTITVTAWSANGGTGSTLSQQVSTVTTVQGAANAYAISLDANASTMTVSGTAACATGAVGATFGSVGTSPVTFNVAFTDPAGKTITAPGLPTIEIQDNGGTYQTASGTINATGGTVSFTINQSAQAFTLTPGNSNITNATVAIKAVPPNGSDGLSFSQTKSFTFSTGVAPPSSFLAVVEQSGANGKIDLYALSLGATDTFTPYAVPSLAITNSTNESKPDVDNPRAMLFDSNGNLLIANGGQGGTNGDYGDFACVPAGAISTGASTATTSSTNAKDPESIALDTDGSVVIGNVPASASYNTVAYTLGSTYTAAPVARDIANAGGTLGALDVVALPGAAQSGTYAAAITDGTTTSKVVIVLAERSADHTDGFHYLFASGLGLGSTEFATGNREPSKPQHRLSLPRFLYGRWNQGEFTRNSRLRRRPIAARRRQSNREL